MCLGHIMFKFSFKKNPVEFNPNSGMTKKLMGDKFPLLAERTRKYRALLQELPREELELTTADGLKLKGWFFDAGSKNTAIFVHGKADTFIPCTAAEKCMRSVQLRKSFCSLTDLGTQAHNSPKMRTTSRFLRLSRSI